eukprot:SAG31_NODE_1760_length_7322_cov_2.480011_6_plen_127_part_00
MLSPRALVLKLLCAGFAELSIASDLDGFRSRIFVASQLQSTGDNVAPQFATQPTEAHARGECIVEGGGYGSDDIDAVHAEDMCWVRLPDDRVRMYYASCDSAGLWQIASAVTAAPLKFDLDTSAKL